MLSRRDIGFSAYSDFEPLRAPDSKRIQALQGRISHTVGLRKKKKQ